MPIALRAALQEVLHGWVDDLPIEWQHSLGRIELDFEAVDASLELEPWEPIFPVRRGCNFPGMPKGSHMLRAYEGVAPTNVLCVILGQDPYPEPGFSTGRAFEAGNVHDWCELDKMFSKSVRAYMQLLVAARTGDSDFARDFGDWPQALDTLSRNDTSFQAPADVAGHLESQGVLLLNASMTLSRFNVQPGPHQVNGHLPLWSPLIQTTLKAMIDRREPIVFVGFGDAAADALELANISEGQSGTVGCVLRPHPAFADEMLAMPNPFELCNSYLKEMGVKPIAW
jgi:uracil-DNA glycosylase